MNRFISILSISLIISCFQTNFAQAQSNRLVGKFVALESNLADICFDFCTSRAIFKIERPKSMQNQYILVFVPHLVSQSRESIFIRSSRLKIKVRENKEFNNWEVEQFISAVDAQTKQTIKPEIKAWNFIKEAENETLPFGQKLKVVELAEPVENIIKKLKKTDE